MPRMHDDIRRWMKTRRFVANKPEHAEHAALANEILPIIVDDLTDEDIDAMVKKLTYAIVFGEDPNA